MHTHSHDVRDVAKKRGVVDLKVKAKHAEQDEHGNGRNSRILIAVHEIPAALALVRCRADLKVR